MNPWTTTLRPGLPLTYDGEQYTVAEIEGRRILLKPLSAQGRRAWPQVDVSALLAHPSTRFLVETPPAEPAAAATLGGLSPAQDDALTTRFRHVQEVRFGYQLGSAELALQGEPRPDYAPGVPLMHRYKAKAAELGVSATTVRRWVALVEESGPAGLVSKREPKSVLERADPRWLDTARAVLKGLEKSSRPVRGMVLMEIEERLVKEHGHGVVAIPKQTMGYALLKELSRGTNAFEGSTKGKRSIANRPPGVYGRLRATRPGEYVVLDTNSLDVFAMEPVTCRWVRCELTIACARPVTDHGSMITNRACCGGGLDGSLHGS